MSAILSADDLNDFISPGVACIKPVETLPLQKPEELHVCLTYLAESIITDMKVQNPYEVTTEDKLPTQDHATAQISLTDCLACSGCVTSAEAVLISLQSHSEVVNTLNAHPSIPIRYDNLAEELGHRVNEGKIFVASVSPQVRASIAATYGVSELKAGWMIDQLLGGPFGLASGGRHGSGFTWIVDTNAMREACLVLGADEAATSTSSPLMGTPAPKKPVLTSACPGWICYAEKTHPHVLPHLSRLKSPQALTGTLLKTVLCQHLNIRPDQVWHLAVMPCFDKKLEASRGELTDVYWRPSSPQESTPSIRDVDCVITARELLMLADTRGISFPSLPQVPISTPPFPDPILDSFLFSHHDPQSKPRKRRRRNQEPAAGPSGGYLHHVLQTQLAKSPGSKLHTIRGRNADVVEYTITRPLTCGKEAHSTTDNQHLSDGATITKKEEDDEETIFRAARYYGFRNIQNLVRKLKPPRTRRLPGATTIKSQPPSNNTTTTTTTHHTRPSPLTNKTTKSASAAGPSSINEYAYVEVMACPGGCTNGGGQIKVDDLGLGPRQGNPPVGMMNQKEWLEKVDEAYYSMSSSDSESLSPLPTGLGDDDDGDVDVDMRDEEGKDDGEDMEDEGEVVNGIHVKDVREVLRHWSESTGIEMEKLCFTTFREVKSDVGKGEKGEKDRVVELAGRIGGGW
ncbi:MAG: hypothetical protein Q9171_001980 [Xanthocarpia ochracea]